MVTDFTFAGISALVLAIVGIAIMLILHGRQTEQSDRLQSMISQQTELIKDTREVYAQTFVDYVQLVSNRYQNVIDRYENYTKIESIDEDFLKSKDKKGDIREHIKRQYDFLLITRQPKIEFMELVKTFGKNIAYRHWTTTAKMNAEEWLPHNDQGLAMLMSYFKEVMYFQLELKDDFLEYCDDATKTKDLTYMKNYDLIKKEWLRDEESD